MPFYEKGNVRIRYEEAGSGTPLLVISGGGLNSLQSYLADKAPFTNAHPWARDLVFWLKAQKFVK